MSFISSFKRALGFPGEFEGEEEYLENEDLTDDDLIDDPDPSLDETSAESGLEVNLNAPTGQNPPISDEEFKEMADDIFDAVLKYFNTYQPELVQRCLDLDAQRMMVIKELDQSLRSRLISLADRACRSGENRWAEKQKRMGEELMKLKSEYNNVRQQREEFQSAQLSATRQKRALNERINDLEAQVMALEAEREQYQLENRSMASRLRVLDSGNDIKEMTGDSSTDKLQEENNGLKAELDSLKSTLEQRSTEIKELTAQLAESRDSVAGKPSQEELEEFHEIRKQMSALRQAKELSESHIVQINKELKECNATINRLQKQLADSAIKVEEQKAEIESLNSTIEANLYAHASAETELRKQISDLQSFNNTSNISAHPDITEPQKGPETKRNKNKRKRTGSSAKREETGQTHIKISAIDELMDNTDWFVAPEPIPLKKDPEVEENFGYKEPAKKPESPNDDRQLTLW